MLGNLFFFNEAHQIQKISQSARYQRLHMLNECYEYLMKIYAWWHYSTFRNQGFVVIKKNHKAMTPYNGYKNKNYALSSCTTRTTRFKLYAFSSYVTPIQCPECRLCSSHIIEFDELMMLLMRCLPYLYQKKK